MIKLATLFESERIRVTTFETNEDGTVTRRLFWKNADGTEETIKETTLLESELHQKLQEMFAMNE
jgi:hypothetical protein